MRAALQPREDVEPGAPWWTGYTSHEFREILELARRWERLEINVKKAVNQNPPPRDAAMRQAQQDLLFVVQPAMQVCEKPSSQYARFQEFVELRGQQL